MLAEKDHFWKTMRLWAVVLPLNVLGALAFAALASLTHALRPGVVQSLGNLGLQSIHHPAATIFWSGVMSGWIIATVAWLVSGLHSITGSVMIIWMLAFVPRLGELAHCIAASGEVFTAILTGHAAWMTYPTCFFPAVAGNIRGGEGMVTLLECGQVIIRNGAKAEASQPSETKTEDARADSY